MRFLLEITEGVTASVGSDRLGVRLSPFGQYGGIYDSSPMELFTSIIEELNLRKLAYLHLIEGRGSEIGLSDAYLREEDAAGTARRKALPSSLSGSSYLSRSLHTDLS